MKKFISEKGFRNLAIIVLLLLAGSCLDYYGHYKGKPGWIHIPPIQGKG